MHRQLPTPNPFPFFCLYKLKQLTGQANIETCISLHCSASTTVPGGDGTESPLPGQLNPRVPPSSVITAVHNGDGVLNVTFFFAFSFLFLIWLCILQTLQCPMNWPNYCNLQISLCTLDKTHLKTCNRFFVTHIHALFRDTL